MAQPIKTPVDQSLVARVAGALRYAATGKFPDGWFGPGDTVTPVAPAPEVEGRRFDFPVGFNTRFTPRGEEAVSFSQMRQLADTCDILRLVIETRKDQMAKMKWKIVPIDPKQQTDERCAAATAFFRSPDKEHTWDDWLRMLLEDLFVIDAPTLYPRRNLGGGIYSMEPVDGSTIKRVLDEFGRTPQAPLPAYQQILKGMPAVDYTRDELIYKPRNPRVHKVYGYSPVEQIIVTVNMALRRTTHIMEFYRSGSVPDALASVPASWNPDQIAQFQQYWDLMLSDDLAERRKMRFIPDGVKYVPTKDAVLKDEFDEWLARIVCFAFSIAPTPFVKQQNRATAETAHQQSITEGLGPLQIWTKSLVDSIVQRHDLLGMADLCFAWDEEEATDPQVQAEIQDTRIRNGSMTIDEARQENGDEPLPDGLGSTPLVFTGSGAVTLESVLNPPPPPAPIVMPGGKPDGDPGNKDKPDDSAKLEKKKFKGIDKDRPAVAQGTEKLRKVISAFLTKQAPTIIAQVLKGYSAEKVSKSGQDEAAIRAAHAKRVGEILDDLDFTEWDKLIPDAEEVLSIVAKDGAKEGLLQVNTDIASDALDQANERAVAYARDRSAELVGMRWDEETESFIPNPDAKWQITESTREFLRADVEQAMDEGWSNDKLSATLADNYGFSEERADMIARTETARADVQGNIEGFRASGQVDRKQWLTAPDCCDECQDINGEIVGIDENFSTGDDGPPLHPNCRCAILPVLTDDES